jgi:hypothetical protein
MPLSDHEQRILAEIERRLLEEDPKFAQQVGSSFQAHLARRLKLAAVGFALGLVVVVVGPFVLESVALGVTGFIVMLVAIFEFLRTLRRRAAINRPAASAGQPPPRPRSQGGKGNVESWWARMNERWRQRWEERGGGSPPGP